MKAFIGTISLISLLFASATEAINNFTNPGPGGNTVIQAGGGATTISWQIDTSEPTITLVLKNNQQTIVLINQGRNTGTFIWNVPENLPSGTYTFEIGVGAPGALTGSSISAPFKIQPCMTCSSVPSTASYTPTGTNAPKTTLSSSHTTTATGAATGGGVTLKASDTTAATGATASGSNDSGTASSAATAGVSGSKTGTAAGQSSAGHGIEVCARGVVVLIGLWIATVVLF